MRDFDPNFPNFGLFFSMNLSKFPHSFRDCRLIFNISVFLTPISPWYSGFLFKVQISGKLSNTGIIPKFQEVPHEISAFSSRVFLPGSGSVFHASSHDFRPKIFPLNSLILARFSFENFGIFDNKPLGPNFPLNFWDFGSYSSQNFGNLVGIFSWNFGVLAQFFPIFSAMIWWSTRCWTTSLNVEPPWPSWSCSQR